MNKKIIISETNISLYEDIKKLIEETRLAVAQTVNIGLTLMFWNIGQKINQKILKNKRAEYGKQIIATVSQQLIEEYGKGFSHSALARMCLFNETFPDFKIVTILSHKLSWSHFVEIISIKNELENGEESPIGLILCAEGKNEQIELLQLEKSNIKVAEYITEILPKELLRKKLHKFYVQNKALIEENET